MGDALRLQVLVGTQMSMGAIGMFQQLRLSFLFRQAGLASFLGLS